MTQEELEVLNKAKQWLENIAETTKSCLLDGELSKIARSLEYIINKYGSKHDLLEVQEERNMRI